MNKKFKQIGFSIVELMIVISIIGIITAISTPYYQSYTATSDVLNCHREISSGRALFEIRVNNGETITPASNLISINVLQTGACKSHALTENMISGVVSGNVMVSGAKINLIRNLTTGIWSCVVSNKPALWTDDFLPADCN